MFLTEGSDHTGKTILSQTVHKIMLAKYPRFDCLVSNMSRPHESFDFGMGYLLRNNPLAIQDRFHLGGIVYHTDKYFVDDVHHPANSLSKAWLMTLDAALMLQGSFVVVLTSDPTLYEKRLMHNPERQEMFKFDALMEYNYKWCKLMRGESPFGIPRHDVLWQATEKEPFVPEAQIAHWVDEWVSRLMWVMMNAGRQVTDRLQFPYRSR